MNVPKAKNANCQSCPLGAANIKLVPSLGRAIKLIVVGDAPSTTDAFYQKPFVSQEGKYLRHVLKAAGFNMSEVFFTYAVMCDSVKFKHNKLVTLTQAATSCRGRLQYALNTCSNNVPVLVVGGIAQKILGITIQDRWTRLEGGKWAIATLSPAEVMQSPVKAVFLKRSVDKLCTRGESRVPPLEKPLVITEPQQLAHLSTEYDKLCVDIETNTYDANAPDARIVLFGFSYFYMNVPVKVILTGEVVYSPQGKQFIQELIRRNAGKLGGHNFKFDLVFLHKTLGCELVPHWDTMLGVKSIHEHWYKDLKSLVTYWFDVDDYSERLVGSWLRENVKKAADRTYDKVPQEQLIEYLNNDLHWNLMLEQAIATELWGTGKYEMPYQNFELPLSLLLAKTEARGFTVDVAQVKQEQHVFKGQMDKLSTEVIAATDGAVQNPASSAQVSTYLFDTLKLPFPSGTGEKVGSTAAPVLDKLEEQQTHPSVSLIKKFRRVAKLKNSYLDNLLKLIRGAKVYPSYKQAHVITGRLSAANPAIQTIPKRNERKDGDEDYGNRIKMCYIASPGHKLVIVDGSQWELRVATAWSQDPYMVDIYNRGIDFHGEMCDLLYGPGWTGAMRTIEKNIVFGLLYGGKLESLVSVAHIPDMVKMRVVNVFNTHLGRILRWRDELLERAKLGGITSPYFNRTFHFDLINNNNHRDVVKQAVNYPVQGTASDITCAAAIEAQPRLEALGAGVIGLVHDSIIADVPEQYEQEAVTIITRALEDAGRKVFPIIPWVAEAEVGYKWGDMQKHYTERATNE